MPLAPSRGGRVPVESSNWRQQAGAANSPRLGRGALTFRGTLAGRGRLDVQGGSQPSGNFQALPSSWFTPPSPAPRHAAFPEPRANVSSSRLSPLIRGKQGGGMKATFERSPAGKRARRPGRRPGVGSGFPSGGGRLEPRTSEAPRPCSSLAHPRLGLRQHSCRCTACPPPGRRMLAGAFHVSDLVLPLAGAALRLLLDTARQPGI